MSEVAIEIALMFGSGLVWFAAHDVIQAITQRLRAEDEDESDLEERTGLAFRATDRQIRKIKKRLKALETKGNSDE